MALIAGDPALAAEARMYLPVLRQAAVAPAAEAGVKRVLGSRMATLPPMEMSEGQWAAWWRDYVDVLGEIPEAALEHGMRLYLRERGADFLPKPWKLRELASSATTTAATHYARAKAAAEASARQTVPACERVDPAAVSDLMAGFRANMDRGRERRAQEQPETRRSPPKPPISAPVGETGVSAELRSMVRGEPAEGTTA